MTARFWYKRSSKYDDAIKTHDDVYKKTIETSTSLLSSADTVLDFGCGSGEMSLDIAAQVQRLHGIDTSANMLDLTYQKARVDA